jgi:translation initiation factor 2 beta subunit (eIF-2beta)/eIF-5
MGSKVCGEKQRHLPDITKPETMKTCKEKKLWSRIQSGTYFKRTIINNFKDIIYAIGDQVNMTVKPN